MKEIGRVLVADERSCEVEFERSSACASCGACSRFEGQSMRTTLSNTLGAKPGDLVEVEMSARNVLGASAWAYIFPLCMMVLGAVFGRWVLKLVGIAAEWPVAVIALAFVGLSFAALRLLNPYFAARRGFTPLMVAILNKDEC
jgi:sigma-E factor negative regulatory protein RseC